MSSCRCPLLRWCYTSNCGPGWLTDGDYSNPVMYYSADSDMKPFVSIDLGQDVIVYGFDISNGMFDSWVPGQLQNAEVCGPYAAINPPSLAVAKGLCLPLLRG